VLVVAVACGPIDGPAGHLDDQAQGPVVELTRDAPLAMFTFSVTMNDAAVESGGKAGFQITGDELGLGYRKGPMLPVVVEVRSVDGRPVVLRRGWCRSRCTGTFEIVFQRRSEASGPVQFPWGVGAIVNFPTVDVPDGAAMDVAFA